MQIRSKAEAQQRVDQIEAFRAELDQLHQEQVVRLDPDQQARVGRYHTQFLDRLAATFDIDLTGRDKHLGLGMRITSLIGTLALAASLFFLYFQYWGTLPTQRQVSLAVTSPFFGLLLTMAMARWDRSGFLAQLFGLLSLVSLVCNLVLLGELFNFSPTPRVLLIWSIFTLLLAYALASRLLLTLGMLCLAAFLATQAAVFNGSAWLSSSRQPEMVFPAAVLLFLVSLVPHRGYVGFAALYRSVAMLLFFVPVLILSHCGAASVLDADLTNIETAYQITGFTFSAILIGLGIRLGWPEVVSTSTLFFILLLYTKLFHWCWEWMPKYQFFLIIGLSAILMLLILKRLRHHAFQRKAEQAA